MDDFTNRVNLKVTCHPLKGNEVDCKENISPIVVDKKLRFDLSAADIQGIIEGSESGTILFQAIARNISNGKEKEEVVGNVTIVEYGGVLNEQGVRTLEKGARALSELAEREITDVNILKSTFSKNPLSILFHFIEAGTNSISFKNYRQYVDRIFCLGPEEDKEFKAVNKIRYLPFNDTDNYRVLKVATEAFLMLHAGVCCNLSDIGDEDKLIQHFASLDIRFATGDDNSLDHYWKNYLIQEDGLFILPYLYLIKQKFGDIGITTSWIDDLIEQQLCNCSSEQRELAEKCFGIVRQRLQCPLFIELIWAYWQEEGMLVQTVNAITRRFQNMRVPGKNDPLAEMEISHLRPLNNLLWGYIQDEQHRLSIVRRAYEYDHHYGITLQGKAVPSLNSADSRTRFIEAFHGLLNIIAKYYNDSANKLVEPDAFPLLNAIREIHFIIAEGMHNQYGDLPSTARIEMLMQQWILARPEFREFLPGRAAIPFTEPWMDRVASMNKLQNWTDTSPMHFDYLAKYGEQILLSIRFGDWSNEGRNPKDAALWANYFRNQIQGYIHSYKTVTGVDLAATVVGNKIDARPPSYHLARRLKERQNGQTAKPPSNGTPPKKGGVNKEWF